MEWLHAYAARWTEAWTTVGAIATSIAVVIALLSSVHERRARRRADARADAAERARDAERERADVERATREAAARVEQHKAQALQVIAWVEHRRATSARFDESGERVLPDEHAVRFVNQSPAPLFDVGLHVFSTEHNTQTAVAKHPVVPGLDSGELLLPEGLQARGHSLSGVVTFRDLQGTRWRRHENGYLSELDEFGQQIG